jgi:glutathione S-transferase
MQNPDEQTARPILYSFRRCPYAIRARLVLAVCGPQVELREIILRDKAPEFLATSPTATVPCMRLPDGTVIDESLDIMIWATARHDPQRLCQPGRGTYEEMLELVERCEDEFKGHLDRYKYASRYDDVDGAEERAKASVYLRELDGRLRGNTFLFGGRRSFADIGIAPFVRQFAHVDLDWFNAQDWPDLIRWLDVFKASEAFKSVMTKHPRWNAGDPVTLYPAEKFAD